MIETYPCPSNKVSFIETKVKTSAYETSDLIYGEVNHPRCLLYAQERRVKMIC